MEFPKPSHDDIEAQFLAFLHSNNIIPSATLHINTDGNIHRFNIQGDKRSEKSAAYCIFFDEWPVGWAMDWHDKISHVWHFSTEKLSEEQTDYLHSDEFKTKVERARALLDEKIKLEHLHASAEARTKLESCNDADEDHPYLQKKNVYPYGIKLFDNGDGKNSPLAVPLKDIHGVIQSLQWIYPDGTKYFYPGASTKGVFWSVGLDALNINDRKAVILIGEGFATMAKIYELTGFPAVAAMNCGNIPVVAEAFHAKFPNARILITADNDMATQDDKGFNPGIKAAQDTVKSGHAVSIIFPTFDNNNDGSDWDDFSIIHGDDYTASFLKNEIVKALIPQNIKDIQGRTTTFNAQDLRSKIFPPIKWAVNGFLPAGLSILAGGPKIGKSILALHLAVGVAIGGCVLGSINVKKGSVLYLALEDTPRRLQERINYSNILDDDDDLSKLTIVTNIPRQHEGGLEYIDWWLDQYTDARLVIIDTFQMFRKLLSGKGSMYAEDYDAVSRIKSIADKYNVAFLILHHLKKGMEGDWLSEISGSQGIAGAADTIFSLKRERNSNMGTLRRTGRDVEEKDFIMKLDGFGWQLMGEAEDMTMPEWKSQILTFLKDNLSVTPIQLAQTYGLDAKTAQKNLQRLAKEGLIRKTGFGTYGLPEE